MARKKRVKRQHSTGATNDVDPRTQRLRGDKVLPLIEKLDTADPAERVLALHTIEALLDEPRLRELFLKEKLVHKLLTTILNDPVDEIANQGFGLVRNLVVSLGRDIAVFIYRQNVSSSINAAVDRISAVFSINTSPEIQKLARDFAENVLCLSTALAQVSDELFQGISMALGPKLIEFAHAVVQMPFQSLCEAGLETLYTFSESAALEKRYTLTEPAVRSNLAEVYFFGIGLNICTYRGQLNSSVVEVLSNILKTLDTLTSSFSSQTGKIDEYTSNQDPNALTAAQIALELLSLTAEALGNEPNEKAHELLALMGIPAALNYLQHHEMRLSATLALNNIGWTLLQHNKAYFDEQVGSKIWEAVLPMPSTVDDCDLINAILGVLGSCAKAMNGNTPLQDSSVWSVWSIANEIGDVETRAQLTRNLIILLAVVCPKTPHLIPMTTKILTTVLEETSPAYPEPAIEALMAIFEIFADNQQDYNQELYIDSGLHAKLVALKPALKRTLRGVQEPQEVRQQALEAYHNLGLFLDYKSETI